MQKMRAVSSFAAFGEQMVDLAEYTDVESSAQQPAAPARASTACPRLTWTSLHVVGLGLLYLSGAWLPSADAITVLAVLTTLLYAAASLVNPGYLPRPADETAKAAAPKPLAVPLVEHPQCMHCQARQVPRAKHCHDCGRCVQRLDHHCWWLGTCVGAGNHRLFVSYLICEAALLCTACVEASSRFGGSATAPVPVLATAAAIGCSAMCATLGLLSLTLLTFQVRAAPSHARAHLLPHSLARICPQPESALAPLPHATAAGELDRSRRDDLGAFATRAHQRGRQAPANSAPIRPRAVAQLCGFCVRLIASPPRAANCGMRADWPCG